MLKNPVHLAPFLLCSLLNITNIAYADESDQWQQFRAHKGMNELDAQFDQPEPEVRVVEKVVEVEKIVEIEVEKVVIKEVPVAVVQPQSEPVVIAVPESDSDITVESDGYVFKLGNCQMSRRNIKCDLKILSVEHDGSLALYSSNGSYSTKLFDRNGNEYIPSKISMGNKSNQKHITNQYIAGVTAKGSIIFENVDKSTQAIALIDLSYHDYTDRKYKHVKFRNVSLGL